MPLYKRALVQRDMPQSVQMRGPGFGSRRKSCPRPAAVVSFGEITRGVEMANGKLTSEGEVIAAYLGGCRYEGQLYSEMAA